MLKSAKNRLILYVVSLINNLFCFSKKIPIGGQAVIEGVVMKGPNSWAMAVRKPNGEIEKRLWKSIPWTKKNKLFALPLIRGVITMAEMMTFGIKALSLSANIALEEEQESLSKKEFALTAIIAIALVVFLFIVIPTVAGKYWQKTFSFGEKTVEGITRAIVFITYIWIIGLWKETRKLFEYHGAEHKTINAYENSEQLTPESVSKYSRIHNRCGTSFLLIAIIVSIVVFSPLPDMGILGRILSRIILLPLVVGLSYEIIKSGAKNKLLLNLAVKPTLWLQKLTTKEPNLKQIEVAIVSLNLALEKDEVMQDGHVEKA